MKHDISDWHLAAVEKQALSLAVMDHGNALLKSITSRIACKECDI